MPNNSIPNGTPDVSTAFTPLVHKLAELRRADRAGDERLIKISRRELEIELVMSRRFFESCLADWRSSVAQYRAATHGGDRAAPHR